VVGKTLEMINRVKLNGGKIDHGGKNRAILSSVGL